MNISSKTPKAKKGNADQPKREYVSFDDASSKRIDESIVGLGGRALSTGAPDPDRLSLSSNETESSVSMAGCVMAYTFVQKARRFSRSFTDDSKERQKSLSTSHKRTSPGQALRKDKVKKSQSMFERTSFEVTMLEKGEDMTQTPIKEDETTALTNEAEAQPGGLTADFNFFLTEMIFSKDKALVNSLLLALPFAIASALLQWSDLWIFSLNFIAMIPLAALLGDFTEAAASHVGQTLGGLLNASFGNAVEVVVSIQALRANEIRVVQASLMGSVLSNLLLVLGTCFFFGGIVNLNNNKDGHQTFNIMAAKSNCLLLLLSSLSLVLPTPLGVYYELDNDEVLFVSRTSAVCLLFMYCQLLFFQLKTHKDMFQDDEEEEEEGMSLLGSIIGLASITAIVAWLSGFLVDSIDGFTRQANLSKTFVGIVLLPIIGNVVEHIAAVTVAIKDKMELSMGIAVGSGTQISMFVVPATVLAGWAMGRDMTLLFPTFEITLYVICILIVAHAVGQGRSNWLFGSMLMSTYVLICVAFWFEKVATYESQSPTVGTNP